MLGDKLKEIRKQNKLTLEKLAEIFSENQSKTLSKGMISNWENNKVEPSRKNLEKYCQLFGVSMDYLLDLNDDLKIKNKILNEIIDNLKKLSDVQLKKVKELIDIFLK